MADTEDWNDLRAAWVDDGPVEPPIDVDGLIRQVRRATRKTILSVMTEVVMAVGAIGFIGYDIASGATVTFNKGLGIFLIAFTIVASIWARGGPWTNRWETLEELLDVAEQRALMAIRCARAGYGICAVATAALLTLWGHDVLTGDPLHNVRVIALSFLVLGVTCWWTRRSELRRWTELDKVRRTRDSLRSQEAVRKV